MTRFLLVCAVLAGCSSSSGGGGGGVDAAGSGSGSGGNQHVACTLPPGAGNGSPGTHCNLYYDGDATTINSVKGSCAPGGGTVSDTCASDMLAGCCIQHVGQSGQPGSFSSATCVYADAGAQEIAAEMQNCAGANTWQTTVPTP